MRCATASTDYDQNASKVHGQYDKLKSLCSAKGLLITVNSLRLR